MNNQLARSLFMDYLYDEISEEEKTNLETYLQEHSELQQELSELQQTRSLLQKMPEGVPAQKLLVMEPRSRTFLVWWQDLKNIFPQTLPGKTAVAAAAVLTFFLFVGSVAQLHIDTSSDGFAISMGYSPTVNQGISSEQAKVLVNQIRQENAAMLSEYAEAINRQNKEQLQQVVNYFQQQRINDLQLVDQTLDEFQQNTNDRLYQTNRYLGQMLQTVSLKDQN